MLIKEFRIPLPMTVEEYQVAQLFCVAEVSKENTGGGDGVEVLKNEPFENYPLLNGEFTKGQYTHKIYHIASKVPAFLRVFLPKGSLELHEQAWNAYPYCRTVLSNPGYMKDSFNITIETLHVADAGVQNNAHKLSADKLNLRSVHLIDIRTDPSTRSNYQREYDPKFFKSNKTKRGPLTENWVENAKPLMTCYKLVTVEFKWFGLQSKVEDFIQQCEEQLFLNFHRMVFCTMDKWYGLTISDIRALEENTKQELNANRNKGEIRGMKTGDE